MAMEMMDTLLALMIHTIINNFRILLIINKSSIFTKTKNKPEESISKGKIMKISK